MVRQVLCIRPFQVLTSLQGTQKLSIGEEPASDPSENVVHRKITTPFRTQANRTFEKPCTDITDSFTKAAAGESFP